MLCEDGREGVASTALLQHSLQAAQCLVNQDSQQNGACVRAHVCVLVCVHAHVCACTYVCIRVVSVCERECEREWCVV